MTALVRRAGAAAGSFGGVGPASPAPAGAHGQHPHKARRHRVFAKFLGKVAFVNAFFESSEAARLTLSLRKRYGNQGATFWHIPRDAECTTKWPVLRACLQDAVRVLAPTGRPIPRDASDELRATAIAEFSSEHGVTKLPPGPGSSPSRGKAKTKAKKAAIRDQQQKSRLDAEARDAVDRSGPRLMKREQARP